MEDHQFDTLLTRVARQTSRRKAVAALLGGLALLGGAAASEANDKAKRRKQRRRKQRRRRRHHAAQTWRQIAIQVDNTAGTQAIHVMYGAANKGLNGHCCYERVSESIPAGEYRHYNFHAYGFSTGFVYINRRYWFQFTNPLTEVPYAQIAINGAFAGAPGDNVACCYLYRFGRGNTVEFFRTFRQGITRFYNIEGTANFRVRRHSDLPQDVFFEVKTPPVLGGDASP